MPKLASGEDGEWSYAVYYIIPNKIKRKKKKKMDPNDFPKMLHLSGPNGSRRSRNLAKDENFEDKHEEYLEE